MSFLIHGFPLTKSTIGWRIVRTLNRFKRLTAMQVYNKISHDGARVTYQAVHKSLKGMVASKVALKEDEKYFLNEEWREEVRKFLKEFSRRY